MPCPHGVNIPVNFELYNNATVFQGSSTILCRNLYRSLPKPNRPAPGVRHLQRKMPPGDRGGRDARAESANSLPDSHGRDGP